MNLSEREYLVKEYMEKVFVPILHHNLKQGNPVAYEQWNGNACRQTATFGLKFLEKLLPHYKWQAWDGIFDDFVRGRQARYNHAWIYGEGKDKNLLVDLSRILHERLFIPVEKNEYPKGHKTYENMSLVQAEQIDIKDNMKDAEFYTSKMSTKLLMDLKKQAEFEMFRKELKGIE